MKLDKRKVKIAILCFVTIGLLSDRLIDGISVFVIPGIFGLVIPLINWTELRERKIIKLTFLLMTNVIIFYLSFFAAMTLGKNSLVIVAIICGLAGVGQYFVSSIFIKSLDKGVIQIIFVLALGLLSIPTAVLLADMVNGGLDNTPSDFFFLTWTIQVGTGISLGQRLTNEQRHRAITVDNKV
jgi:hypothetical protein